MKTYPDIISRLKVATPQKRTKIIKRLYNKNLGYFAVKHPAISDMLKKVPCPYEITITNDFLEIIDSRTGEKCPPQVRLDRFAETLGDWTNSAWEEFLRPVLHEFAHESKHSATVASFNNAMHKAFPQFAQRFITYRIILPATGDGLRFSNPIIFMGIFHGLHIAHYLSRTHVRAAMFMEPEPQRFEVSCYFLDYEALDAQFNGLLLHVGNLLPQQTFATMVRRAIISNPVWTRVLGAYASERFEPLINQLRMDWAAINDEWVPADRELQAFRNGLANLKSGIPLLLKPVKLSAGSRVVVVGAGPSLTNDLDWLRDNQDKLIIFATHSAIIPLKKHGIRPDFQFSLDIDATAQEIEDIQYDYDVPIVTDFQMDPGFLVRFRSGFMVVDGTADNNLLFHHTISRTHPTTGNLTVELACYCQPAAIYLVGLDLGFRSTQQTHARGGIFDTPGMDAKVMGQEQWEVETNFADASPVYTRGHFNNARRMAAESIESLPPASRTYNLSDGSRIDGALPRHSAEVSLSSYPEKSRDIEAIKTAFAPSAEGVHWRHFSLPGRELVDLVKTTLLEKLQMQSFSWPQFSEKIDSALFTTQRVCQERSPNDLRMMPYFRIVHDLFHSWYSFMVFTNTAAEAEYVYKTGLSLISDVVKDFKWPGGLD